MASVYGRIKGQQIEKVVAMTREVQDKLDEEVLIAFAKAEARLQAHRHSGNALLTVDEGKVDRYLSLEDPPASSSPGAAMSIEFGHFVGKGEKRQWVEGLWILHDATGLPRRSR